MLLTNNLKRYSIYALGEILIIICGIAIAVQLNNNNASRQKEKEFNVTLEQLYNTISIDMQIGISNFIYLDNQITLIDSLLNTPDAIPDNKLIHLLYYLDCNPIQYNSESAYYFSLLQVDPSNHSQIEIAKNISVFISNKLWDLNYNGDFANDQPLSPLLLSENIPDPGLMFGFSSFDNFGFVDTLFFTDKEITKAKELIQTEAFRTAMRTLRTNKSRDLRGVSNSIEAAESLIALIENYNPDVVLNFQDIGIIGSAFETGYYKSIPMTKRKGKESIWEITTTLNDGRVKFRSNNSWNQNWGGTTFPDGETFYFGPDISVKKGKYHITLDLNKHTYLFEQME